MSRHLIITVHGIRTFGDWQERLESTIPAPYREKITFHHYKFGYFSFFKFIFPPARWVVTKRFAQYLRKEVADDKWCRIDLVGHSFGTHVIGWALRNLGPHIADRRVHTVIFASSVLRSTFDWSGLLGKCLTRLVNDCSTNDIPLIFSKLFSLFTGSAGREGFVGPISANFQNRYFTHGHSGYFRSSRNRTSKNDFMKEYWLPLLLDSQPIEPVSRSPRSTSDRFLDWICTYADPLKLAFYLTPVVLVAVWIHGLYIAADTAKRTTLRNEAKALTSLAHQKLAEGDSTEALRLALMASTADKPKLAETGLTLYNAFLRHRTTAKLTLPGGYHVGRIFVNSSRHFVATTRYHVETVQARPHLLQIWAIDNPHPILEHHLSAGLGKYAFSPDGRFFAFENRQSRSIRLLRIATGTFVDLSVSRTPRWVRDITFNADGTELRAVTHRSFARTPEDAGRIQVWRMDEQGPPRQRDVPLEEGVFDLGDELRFSPSGAYVWSPRKREFWLWDVATGRRVGRVPRYRRAVVAEGETRRSEGASGQPGRILAFDKKERYLVFSAKPNLPAVWDLQCGRAVAGLPEHDGAVVAAAFSPDSGLLATGSANGEVHVSAIRRGPPTATASSRCSDDSADEIFTTLSSFSAHHRSITHLAITPDSRVFTSSLDGSLRIWDLATGVELSSMEELVGTEPSDHVAFSPDGRFAFVASRVFTGIHGYELRMVDLDSGPPVRVFPSAGGPEARVIVAPNAHHALRVPVTQPTTAELWDVRAGNLTGRITGHVGPILAASFDDTGTQLATASADKTVRIWDAVSGLPTTVFEGHSDSVFAVSFGRHNDRIVTASKDETIRIWNTSQKTAVAVIPFKYQPDIRTIDRTTSVAQLLTLFPMRLSHDGRFLGIVKIVDQALVLEFWNVHTQEAVRRYVVSPFEKPNWKPVFDVCGHTNRVAMVSTDESHELALLDLDREDERRIPTGHRGVILGVRFDDECKLIVTASADKRAHVLDVATTGLIGKSPAHPASILHAAFGPGGRRVVTASEDRKIRVWDFRRNELHIELPLKHHAGVAIHADFSAAGDRLIAVSADASGFRNGVVRIFPLYSRQDLIERSKEALARTEWTPR